MSALERYEALDKEFKGMLNELPPTLVAIFALDAIRYLEDNYPQVRAQCELSHEYIVQCLRILNAEMRSRLQAKADHLRGDRRRAPMTTSGASILDADIDQR